MDRKPTIEELVKELNLHPLIGEGGMRGNSYIAKEYIDENQFIGRESKRPVCSAINYLLKPDTFSCMHRLQSDELWYYHMGPSLEMLLIYPDSTYEIKKLGLDVNNNERPQVLVPRLTWQGVRMGSYGDYSLCSTSVSPAYQDSDFERGDFLDLVKYIDKDDSYAIELLRFLTSELKY